MDELADEYAGRDVGAVFLYTNEAHPGELLPHHTSLEQKMEQARLLRDEAGMRRAMLVDALDGACHRALGGMPNMTWIFDRGARPVYRANWTAVESARSALADLTAHPAPAREGLRPLTVERLEYSGRDREAFMAGLERAGPRAVAEYEALFGK